MKSEKITYQRKLIGVELKLGFLYVPSEARPLMPDETSMVKIQFEGTNNILDKSYNADYNRIFGLTSFYQDHQLDKGDVLSIEVTRELINIKIATTTVIEDQEEKEQEDLIDISGLSSQAKGNIAEDRVKEIILLNSQGLLNVFKPVIDTRGIDMIVLKDGVFFPIYLQIKSRYQVADNNRLVLTISKNTFKKHHANYLVGISFDANQQEIGEHILFMSSFDVIERATIVRSNEKEYYRLNISYQNALEGTYQDYFYSKQEFVEQLLEKFEAMGQIIR